MAGPRASIRAMVRAIKSAGGYLRGLTAKAAAGEFSLGPILMAQINAPLKKTKMRPDS